MEWIGQHIYDLVSRLRNQVIIEPGPLVGQPALTIENTDVDKAALKINASNTTGNTIDVVATANTTGNVLNIEAKATTGNVIYIDDSDTNQPSGSTVQSSAIRVRRDLTNTTSINQYGAFHYDHDVGGTLGDGETSNLFGFYVDSNKNSAGHANSQYNFTGYYSKVDGFTTVDEVHGHSELTGYYSEVQNGEFMFGFHGKVADAGGTDEAMGLRLEEYNSGVHSDDHFGIHTTTHGATKIWTIDAAAAAAHMTIVADGNVDIDGVDITLDASGTIELEGTTNVTGSLTVSSDLTVNGTTTTINTANLNVEDKNITLNYNASGDTSSTADGAGITIQDAIDASNDATILWSQSNKRFDFSHAISLTNGSATARPALVIDHDDADVTAVDINADNTTGNIIDIDAQALTHGDAIFIDSNNLGGGSLIDLDVDDAYTASPVIVATGQPQTKLINIDYDKAGVIGNGSERSVNALDIDMTDAATNHANGTVELTGIDIAIDAASAQGIIKQRGVKVTLTDADTSQDASVGFWSITEDGGMDFLAQSSADEGDYFAIQTTTHGATTLTTVDDDAAAAHFEIAADGNITLDPAGTIALEANTTVTGDLTVNGDTVTFSSANADDPVFILQNTTNDAQGARFQLIKNRGADGVDNDNIGEIEFWSYDDGTPSTEMYAAILGRITDSASGGERGKLEHYVAAYDGSTTLGLKIEGGDASGVVNVDIGAGTASTTTVAGNLTVTNDITVNGGNATINGGSTTDSILKLATNTASASDDVIIELVTDEDGTPRQARIGVDHSDNTLKLVHGSGFSGGTNGICVDSSGNVGLGTASPEAHLHLESAGDTAIIVRADVGNSGEDDNPLIHLQQDFVAAGASGVMVDGKLGIVGNTGQIFTNSLGNSTYITAQGGGSSPNVSMQFATGGNNGQDTDHAAVLPTARMTILHGGNIGIGVNDPDSMLEIFGTSTQLKLSNNASDYATLATGTHGNLTITTVDAAATAAHIELAADGDITLDAAGNIALESAGGAVTSDAATFTVSNASSGRPDFKLQNTTDDTSAAFLTFDKNRYLSSEEPGIADGDTLGTIQWTGTNNAAQLITYANIVSNISEVDDSDEAGKLTFNVAASDGSTSSLSPGLILEGEHATGSEVDVTIANGTGSTTTVSGNLEVTTGIELGHASDTTIARSAAGTVTIEGEQIATNIYTKKIVISQAEMNALATTPKDLIAAPGANKYIDVLSFNLIVDRASTNSISAYLSCSYNGDTSLGGALFLRKSFMLSKTTDVYYPVMRYTSDAGNTDPINKKVTAQLQNSITTNCTTSTTVLITYSIIDVS